MSINPLVFCCGRPAMLRVVRGEPQCVRYECRGCGHYGASAPIDDAAEFVARENFPP